MAAIRNILFLMCDQLRADYLGCYGHPHLKTLHIDALAARGARFTRAFSPSPICGPARMSFYTGRSMTSHGAGWNNYPTRVDDWLIGDFLRPLGVEVALAGKTHFRADKAGLARLGVDPAGPEAQLILSCGFAPAEHDDGLHPDRSTDPELPYNRFLRAAGYPGPNPWHSAANSVQGEDGSVQSGWYWSNSARPAIVAAEHSETAWMTTRAMEYIAAKGEAPWVLHLSYIKPHWPYIAPAPYHALYGPDAHIPVLRDEAERGDGAHPVTQAFRRHRDSRVFEDPARRAIVLQGYMGLVAELDHHVGRLMAFLAVQGRLDDTLIVFTSDHGDYLGDHWLGEKDLFHTPSVAIPLIIVDPRAEADATRGARLDHLVEGIDLLPSFVEALGGDPSHHDHRLEGRSLMPLLAGGDGPWREVVVSESDWSGRDARADLDMAPVDSRAWMLTDGRYKYIHHKRFRPELYDMHDDPDELVDLGQDSSRAAIRAEFRDRLFAWLLDRRSRTTISEAEIRARSGLADRQGILIGHW